MRRLIGLFFILMVWEGSARILHHPIFVPVSRVLPALAHLVFSGEAWTHAATSLRHILLGFSLATGIGLTLGILITESQTLDLILAPVIDAMRPIAALTIFPLLILLLGLGLWSKVFVIFWTAWPAVLLNTAQGIRKVDPSTKEAAQLDGAGRWPLLCSISFPLALPTIMTGLRIGMSGGWISLVSAEMLGSSAGLGYSILAYSQTFRFPEMYATVILIAALGLAMNVSLAWLQSRLDFDREVSHESPFLRFHDRAAGWGLDSLFTARRAPTGGP